MPLGASGVCILSLEEPMFSQARSMARFWVTPPQQAPASAVPSNALVVGHPVLPLTTQPPVKDGGFHQEGGDCAIAHCDVANAQKASMPKTARRVSLGRVAGVLPVAGSFGASAVVDSTTVVVLIISGTSLNCCSRLHAPAPGARSTTGTWNSLSKAQAPISGGRGTVFRFHAEKFVLAGCRTLFRWPGVYALIVIPVWIFETNV